MATIKVVDIIDQTAYMLTDVGAARWTKQKLLDWFNEAQRALVSRRPDSLAVNEVFECVAGVKQRIPDIGIRLIDVVRNTNGKSVTPVSKALLDSHVIDWAAETASTNIQHYIFDARDPKTFYVYPPATIDSELEIIYSKSPDVVEIENFETDDQLIEVDDVWANAMQEYMLHRAWTKDAENVGNMQRATAHLQNFRLAIGDITQADTAITPDEK